jgi:hypothetical protein
MGFLKNLFHFHSYKTVEEKPMIAKIRTVFRSDLGTVDRIVRLDRCSCGKERAYCISWDGDKAPMYPSYAKNVLGIR